VRFSMVDLPFFDVRSKIVGHLFFEGGSHSIESTLAKFSKARLYTKFSTY
jgi:hypothetical protein